MAVNAAALRDYFEASYTNRDVILYAISVGFGRSELLYEKDLQYVYEKHKSFKICPTFGLTLVFWAQRTHTPAKTLPMFPPPLMMHTEVLPRRFLTNKSVSLDGFPVLHTFQSITWNNDLVVPKQGESETVRLRSDVVTVAPKAVGTFVTTETKISNEDDVPVCVVVSTVLVCGLSKDVVCPHTAPSVARMPTRLHGHEDTRPTAEAKVTIGPDTALLYRVCSGDSNHIHVEPNAVSFLGSAVEKQPSRPLLHGLCTLGIVTRVLLQQIMDNDTSLAHLQAEFSKPVLIGARLLIQFWTVEGGMVLFKVINSETGHTVVKNGCAVLRTKPREAVTSRHARL
jgi:acyl dehydratase